MKGERREVRGGCQGSARPGGVSGQFSGEGSASLFRRAHASPVSACAYFGDLRNAATHEARAIRLRLAYVGRLERALAFWLLEVLVGACMCRVNYWQAGTVLTTVGVTDPNG